MRGPLLQTAGALALLPLLTAGPKDSVPPDNAIVVTGQRIPIIVNGRVQRCRPLADDPQDRADARPHTEERRQSVLVPLPGGRGFKLVDDINDTDFFDQNYNAGPGVWRRAGTGIDQYTFRAAQNASVLCIGSKWPQPQGYAQLRQIVNAAPYRGKRVRFTAWVATQNARLVRFWLAGFDPDNYIFSGDIDGGNMNNHTWGGSHGWTPVMLEIGPISRYSKRISFGFLLHGDGDVWLYKPKLEAVEPGDPYQRKGDVLVIGSDESTRTERAN